MTRRDFLSQLMRIGRRAAPLAVSLPWVRFSLGRRSRDPRGLAKAPVIPPGGRSLALFTRVCTGCLRCVSACPTKVLQPSLLEYGLRGILQPVLDFSRGYCEYSCVACSRVCPTGAISRISVGEKREIKVGTVSLVKDDCIVFSKGTACGACAEICPTQAVRMVPYKSGLTQPITDVASCVGCGGCELVCPARPRKAIYVSGIDPHGRAILPAAAPPSLQPPASHEAPPATDGEEFPF